MRLHNALNVSAAKVVLLIILVVSQSSVIVAGRPFSLERNSRQLGFSKEEYDSIHRQADAFIELASSLDLSSSELSENCLKQATIPKFSMCGRCKAQAQAYSRSVAHACF